MAISREKQIDLPARHAIADGDPTDNLSNKPAESRRIAGLSCLAHPHGQQDVEPLLVRLLNVCSTGIGFIARKKFPVGRELEPSPADDPGETICVRVVHCTRTTQGYKVGCVFEHQ